MKNPRHLVALLSGAGLLASVPATASPIRFTEISYPFFATGNAPSSMLTTDLNGDGRGDLIVANELSNTVSVFLGSSAGIFVPRRDYATGSRPVSIALGDLNGDRHVDLVVSNRSSGSLSVLYGNGDGGLQVRRDIEGLSAPRGVAIGDLNRDGWPDLAVTSSGADSVSVLLASGDGTWRRPVSYGTGAEPVTVAIADMNGDGKAELLTANKTAGTISELLGNGDGTFRRWGYALDSSDGRRRREEALGRWERGRRAFGTGMPANDRAASARPPGACWTYLRTIIHTPGAT